MKTTRRLISRTSAPARTSCPGPGPAVSGPLALRGLPELRQHPVALELREVVDEQDAVEVVDLVLHAGGEEPVRILLDGRAVEVCVAEAHPVGALHLLVVFGNREAALLVGPRLVRGPEDLR